MVRVASLLVWLLVSASVCADESYEDRWVRIANEHLALVKVDPGKSYEHELIAAHNTFWKSVNEQCRTAAKKAKIKEFHAVAVVGEDGTITEFLTMPHDKHLACYEQQMVGKHYPKPPSTPFYELIHVTF